MEMIPNRGANTTNIQFEGNGIRVWRSYGIGPGKVFPFEQLMSQSQESTDHKVINDLFTFQDTQVYKCKGLRQKAQMMTVTRSYAFFNVLSQGA